MVWNTLRIGTNFSRAVRNWYEFFTVWNLRNVKLAVQHRAPLIPKTMSLLPRSPKIITSVKCAVRQNLGMILSSKWITKALIRLRGCAGRSARLVFTKPRRQIFSRRGQLEWKFLKLVRIRSKFSCWCASRFYKKNLKLKMICLIWFFTSESSMFQLCRDGSSWVERVLSKD